MFVFQSGSPRRDKFNRYESGSDKDESEEEEEEVETETEVEVTDSEYEAEADSADQQKDKSDDLSTSALNNDEDVLNVDCREEVDEFSKFLNEFETELVLFNVNSIVIFVHCKLVNSKSIL